MVANWDDDDWSCASAEVCSKVQRLRQEGRYEEAIYAAENGLHRAVVTIGSISPDTEAVAADLVLAYNQQAMKMLSENDVKGSLHLLQNAMLLSDRGQPYLGTVRLKVRAVTLNNLGCLMKKWGKPRVAVAYLSRALRIEAALPGGADNPAGTHLNMSAALSAAGMHREAAGYAGHAVEIASREVVDGQPESEASEGVESKTCDAEDALKTEANEIQGGSDSGGQESIVANRGGVAPETVARSRRVQEEGLEGNGTRSNGQAVRGRREPDSESPESRTGERAQEQDEAAAGGLLAIAYFNLGVEREYLGLVDMALEAYRNAHVAAARHLGFESPVAREIEQAVEAVSKSKASLLSTNRQKRHAIRQKRVDSLPSIGKLRLRTQRRRSARADWVSPARALSPRRNRISREYPADEDLKADDARNADRATVRVYTSPRPNLAPPNPSLRPTRSAPSPRTPGSAHVFAEHNREHRASRGQHGMMWRAHACATFGCSPREALYAQHAEERQRIAGAMPDEQGMGEVRRAEALSGGARSFGWDS